MNKWLSTPRHGLTQAGLRTVLCATLVVAVASCGSAGLKGGHSPADLQGIRYHVPKDVAVLELTVTESTIRQINAQLEIETTQQTERSGSVALRTVPDRSQTFFLDLDPGGATDGELAVQLSEGGLLQSINVKTTGRAGEAIQSIAKFVGTLVGLGPLGGFADAGTGCDPFSAELIDLPREVRHYLGKSKSGCELWKAIKGLEKDIEKLEEDRAAIEQTVPALTGTKLAEATKKIKLLKAAAAAARERITEKRSLFSAALEQHKAGLELGTKKKSWRVVEVLELTDLPPSGTVTAQDTQTAAGEKLNGHDRALAVLNRTGAVVQLESLDGGGGTLPDNDPDLGRIFFRQAQTLRLSLLVLEQKKGSSEGELRLVSDQLVDLLHPSSPTLHLSFEKSAFAERGLSLQFDARGRPKTMKRSGTSDVAAVASALAGAATGFRDEVAATLTKVKEIQSTRREIDLSDMSDELARLKKEKEILDAGLARDTANATFEDVLRQNQLAADLATLQAEVSLETAELTREQTLEIELLKVEVDQVNAELDLLKARQELLEAQE